MPGPRKSRWYQFSLRTLLVVVFLVAGGAAWYGYRVRLIEQERSRLAGTWYARFGTEPPSFGIGAVAMSGQGVELHVPYGGIGRIDFQMENGSGISRGIYRWDGDTITVAQSPPNQPRPTSFEP